MIWFYVISFIFCVTLGALGHFIYEWSGHKNIAGVFFAVNESVWEHIKIGLTPMYVVLIVMYFFYGGAGNYFIAKFLGIFVFMVLVPSLFYLYTSILKRHILIVDIIIFVVALLVGVMLDYYVLNLNDLGIEFIGIIGIILTMIMYAVLTFFPLENMFFMDPITKKYGTKGHPCHEH